jgi:hypothetical protein
MTAARGFWLHLDGVAAGKMISMRFKKTPESALTDRRLAEHPVRGVVSAACAVASLAACPRWPLMAGGRRGFFIPCPWMEC